ncbi:MAG: Ig-like domain-containing protein [Planctomycetota bacterium]
MKAKIILLATVGFWVMSMPVLAGELLVPDQYPTIQAAIDAAVDGDVVIVADGTYNGTYIGSGNHNLDFRGRAITVRSENGPEFTTIDCQNYGIGFYFHNSETQNSVVEGFTITNGSSFNGGAISCENSGPTIKDCIFIDNLAENNGGAMYSIGELSPVIENCTFIENRGGEHAGAAYFGNSAALVSGCVFIANFCFKSSGDGGAIYNSGYISPTIVNCLFVGNTASESGGAIRNYYNSPTIINCTFNGNSTRVGGAIHNASDSSPIITNCIFWGNSASSGDEIDNNGDCHPTISYCDIEGGWNGPHVTNRSGSSTIDGGGNIAADPLFIDAVNPDLFARDYHLSDSSPCIDAAMDAGADTDIEGQVRPLDFPGMDNNGDLPEFDIGAYEAAPPPPSEIAALMIEKAIIEKIKAIERIDAALEQEWTAHEALEELLESGDYGDLKKSDIIHAMQQTHSAIQHEELSKKAIQKSIEKLLSSLSSLGYGPQPPGSNWPPNVTIIQPENGAEFRPDDTIEIEADALDYDGSVVMVEFFANGNKIAEDTDGSDGWTTSWSDPPKGIYSLTAIATDNEAAATTSEEVVITVFVPPPPLPPIPPPGPPPIPPFPPIPPAP